MTPTVDKLGKVGKEKLRKTSRAVSEQRKAEQFLKEMETCLETSGWNVGNSRDDLIFCSLRGVVVFLSPAEAIIFDEEVCFHVFPKDQ